jgi:hypothetical protein
MEIEMAALAALSVIAIIAAAQAVKLRRDVLHGPYIQHGFSERFAAIAAR